MHNRLADLHRVLAVKALAAVLTALLPGALRAPTTPAPTPGPGLKYNPYL
jgi:hypothetical protein